MYAQLHFFECRSEIQIDGSVVARIAAQNDEQLHRAAVHFIHEFSEAEVLGRWSEAIHNATEPFSPVGVYGKWFSVLMVGVCAAWLLGVSMKDRIERSRALATGAR